MKFPIPSVKILLETNMHVTLTEIGKSGLQSTTIQSNANQSKPRQSNLIQSNPDPRKYHTGRNAELVTTMGLE